MRLSSRASIVLFATVTILSFACSTTRKPASLPGANPSYLPRFTTAPGNEINQGAVYSLGGELVCILPKSPGAYVQVEASLPVPGPSEYCAGVIAAIEAGTLPFGVEPIGVLSNNDLLRRLVWLYGEGGCNPIETACPRGGKDCAAPATEMWGSLYYAYTMKNLRRYFVSDRSMLGSTAVDAHGNQFDRYFRGGHPNTSAILPVILEPRKWVGYPTPAGLPDCIDKPKCWAERYVPRCLQDIIHAERDTTNADAPFGNEVLYNGWLGEPGPSNGSMIGKVCPNSWPKFSAISWGKRRMLQCFRRMKLNGNISREQLEALKAAEGAN